MVVALLEAQEIRGTMRCHTCDTEIPTGRSDCPTCYTPAGQPAVLPDVRTYSVRGLGLAAGGAVAVALLADAALLLLWPLAGARLIRSAQSSVDGDPIEALAVESRLDAVEGLLSLVQLGTRLAAIALVIVWFYRARANLDAFAGSVPELRTGWAIGGWFVPFANLVIPFRVMADIARASLFRNSTPRLVWVWWLPFLVYYWGGQAVYRYDLWQYDELPLLLTAKDFATWVEYYEQALVRNLPILAAGVLAAVVFILLVVRVSRAQHARMARGTQTGPVMPGMAMPATWPAPQE
jgi:hypothetical protein